MNFYSVPKYSLLLMFPEGFINGTIVTAITVFKPHLMNYLWGSE